MAVEWPQRRRVPAFGGWNFLRDAGGAGVDDDWPVTPCFDSFVRIAAASPAHKFSKQRARPSARRKRIPAFGEWNHDGGSGLPAAVTPFLDLAAAAHRTPKTAKGRDGGNSVAAGKLAMAEPPQGKRWSKVADPAAYAARRSCFTVAKAVDDDLYGIPPHMDHEKPARKGVWLRTLLICCCCCCVCPRGLA